MTLDVVEPILPGFHPDPSICRVGDDYYLVTSSFEYFPAVPVFHSRDLLHWRQIGNVLDRPEQMHSASAPSPASGGIYAPTIRHHAGRFWMITTNVDDLALGQTLVTADDPAGPWSDAIRFPGLVGIDPDLAWDDDGTCYLTYSALPAGGIVQAIVDPASGAVLRGPEPLWSGTGMNNPEGPHLFQHGEWWYLVIAEGGTHTGHAVSVARAAAPTGPFAPAPHNPILTHRSTHHAVQATGHMDLVELADGSWAAVHLGIRQRGGFPRFHLNGRETFLTGIAWRDGWPHVDAERFAVPRRDTSFDLGMGAELDQRWISPTGDPRRFARPGDDGIELQPSRAADEREGSGVLAVRVADTAWLASAAIEGDAAFALRVDANHAIAIQRIGDRVEVRVRIGPVEEVLATATAPAGALLVLSARPDAARRGRGAPDLVSAAIETDGRTVELTEIDGRYLSTEVAGGFTGRVLAIEALGSRATLRRLSYRPAETADRA